MEFTFGIITDGGSDVFLEKIIESIEKQEIPNYEIIIVGDSKIRRNNLKLYRFNESFRKGWITKKKNIICQAAKYENVVLLHDYVCLDDHWYKGFLIFGNKFDFCITQIKTLEGERFRDYMLNPYGLSNEFQTRSLLPYTYYPSNNMKKLMYVSGAYYIIKKSVALEHPLNETLLHKHGEDVEISQRLAKNNIFVECNPHSTVKFLKNKDRTSWENIITSEMIDILNSLSDEQIDILFNKQVRYYHKWISDIHNIEII